MLGSPLFQILFFTYLGRFALGGESDSFFIVGNAVQVCAMAAVYGMTMSVANERQFGTLGPLLASPANRPAVFLGRGIPVLVNGLVVSIFGFVVGVVLLDFHPAAGAWPSIALIVLVTTASCTAFGMLLGSIGLYGRDFFFVANLAYYILLLFCGVNVPLAVLPTWMQDIGRCLPLTHGIAAARGRGERRQPLERLRSRLDGARDRGRLRGGGIPALPLPRAGLAPARRA